MRRIEAALVTALRRGDRRGAVEALLRWVDRPGATPDASDPPTPLERVIAHIDRHFGDPELNLESVATAVSVSPYYIAHLFRRHRGETFLRYVTGCRLAHARALLAGTSLPIGQIAGRSGYSSAKRFRIVFKRHLGCPPAEYRRRSMRQSWMEP